MEHHTFAYGERLIIKGKVFQMRRFLSKHRWQLEAEVDGELAIKSESELRQLYTEGNLSFMTITKDDNENIPAVVEEKINKDFSDYPEDLRVVAQNRLKFIRGLKRVTDAEYESAAAEVAKAVGCKHAPSIKTIQRWTKQLEHSSDNIVSLIPKYSNCGNSHPRYPEEVFEIATAKIREVYLTPQRETMAATLSSIRHAIDLENKRKSKDRALPKPGRKFLRRLIGAIDEYDKMRARYGKVVADREFRSVLKSGEYGDPLSRVEFDHTILDVIVVDKRTFLPLGRPTITVGLDRRTHCILGYHKSFEPPSYVQVMHCLKHAIMPKDYITSRYPEIQNSWPCWGIPGLAVVDNASEFYSKDFEAAALSLLMEIRYAPVRQPWWKGAVERFFRTLNRSLVHTLPGTTFSNPQDRQDYDSLRKAVVTEEVLDELLHTWICDIYHQTVQRSTLHSPAMLWRDLVDPTKQRLPISAAVLDVTLASVTYRTVFHYGIEICSLTYNSRELQEFRRRVGKVTVKVKFNREDLGKPILVLDETTGNYIAAPCTWSSYASGVSEWLHSLIRREAAMREGVENEAKLDAAKERIREICRTSLANKRLVTRKAAARAEKGLIAYGEENGWRSSSGTAQAASTPVTAGFADFERWDDDEEELPSFKVTKLSSRSEEGIVTGIKSNSGDDSNEP